MYTKSDIGLTVLVFTVVVSLAAYFGRALLFLMQIMVAIHSMIG
jgi:hypothetical protein